MRLSYICNANSYTQQKNILMTILLIGVPIPTDTFFACILTILLLYNGEHYIW